MVEVVEVVLVVRLKRFYEFSIRLGECMLTVFMVHRGLRPLPFESVE